jgi:transposase-like protein
MSDFSPPPKETRERLCPHCLSLAVMPIGRVVADRTALRSAYRCEDCAKEFVLLR